MFADMLVIVIIGSAVVTGLWTLHNNQDYFSEFVVADLLSFRRDAILYVSTSLSTAVCLVDLVLRIKWSISVNLEEDHWKTLWLMWHAANALAFAAMHISIGRYLKSVRG